MFASYTLVKMKYSSGWSIRSKGPEQYDMRSTAKEKELDDSLQ